MAFGFTYTLPTITGSHTDFPVVLKTADFPSAALDGTANAIDNGGGNLRAYTDDTKATQLPLEVVTLVSSGSPQAEVWVKVPTAATGNTIYLEADDVATTQPAVTDTYGRNAVWDYPRFHLEDGVDSSGTISDLNLNGQSVVPAQIGNGVDVDTNYPSSATDEPGLLQAGNYRIGCWVDLEETQSTFAGILSIDIGSANHIAISRSGSSDIVAVWHDQSGFTFSNSDVWGVGKTKIDVTYNRTNGDNKLYINGSLVGTVTQATPPPVQTGYNLKVGAERTGIRTDGIIDEVTIESIERSADWVSVENDNHSAVSSWGTVGAWESQGAGISIEAPEATYSFSTSSPTVNTSDTTSIEVPEGSISFTTYSPTVTAVASQDVEVPTGSISFTTYSPTIEAGADVAAEIPTGNISFTTSAPRIRTVTTPDLSITLSASIDISDTSRAASIETVLNMAAQLNDLPIIKPATMTGSLTLQATMRG